MIALVFLAVILAGIFAGSAWVCRLIGVGEVAAPEVMVERRTNRVEQPPRAVTLNTARDIADMLHEQARQ